MDSGTWRAPRRVVNNRNGGRRAFQESITARAKTEGQVRRAIQLSWTFSCVKEVIAITVITIDTDDYLCTRPCYKLFV